MIKYKTEYTASLIKDILRYTKQINSDLVQNRNTHKGIPHIIRNPWLSYWPWVLSRLQTVLNVCYQI